MSTHKLLNFPHLLSTLTEISPDTRADFLLQYDTEEIANLLIEDSPSHLTLLKRIMELLTLVPIEERYIIEEITATANRQHSEHSYNQFRLFKGSDELDQSISDEESDLPSLA